jgi:hypothetical protein
VIAMKMQISNLICTTRFWNRFIRYANIVKNKNVDIGKPANLSLASSNLRSLEPKSVFGTNASDRLTLVLI